MRSSFEPQSVLYQFPVSHIPVLQLYTRLPVALTLTMIDFGENRAEKRKGECNTADIDMKAVTAEVLL